MDFSKLSQTEKLAVYGSAAVIIGGLVGYSYGLTILAVLAAIAMLAIVLLPQMSPGTNLPGSKGSLMLIAGAVAGAVLVLAALLYLGTIFTATDVRDIFFLIAVIGGVVMAWAGWQQFQADGGKLQVGTTASGTPASGTPASGTPAGGTSVAAPPASSAPAVSSAPPAAAAAPPASDVNTSAPETVATSTDPAQSTIDSAATSVTETVDTEPTIDTERRPEA